MISYSIRRKSLFEPVCQVVLGVEEVDGEANPACCENQNGADDFSNERDGFFKDVKHCNDAEYYSDKIDNAHGFGFLIPQK